MDDTLRNALRSLWFEQSSDNLHEVKQVSQSEDIVERVFTFEKGSDGELTVNYLKDVFFFCR